jgi:FdhE protein
MFIESRKKRLQELGRKHPLFADIFDFYGQLYGFFGEEREQEPFLTAAPGRENPELRRREGFPLLSGESLAVDPARTRSFLFRLLVVLELHGRQGFEDLAALKQAVADDRLDLARLLRASLDRDRRPLMLAAEKAGCQPAILEFVIDMALGYALKRCREEGLTAVTDGWTQGYCPLCGGVPVMGELCGEEGKKQLHCGTCGTSWSYTRLKCAHCGNDDVATLEYFTAEGDASHRVNVCRKCSCYLKLVDSRAAGAELPLDIEDLATLHLDLLAQQEGFTRGKKGESAAG